MRHGNTPLFFSICFDAFVQRVTILFRTLKCSSVGTVDDINLVTAEYFNKAPSIVPVLIASISYVVGTYKYLHQTKKPLANDNLISQVKRHECKRMMHSASTSKNS